ncbi:MAG: transcriptional repressor [Candidatus Eisenbacteria bacterium]|nr:transcriptional repressor [Candidatus Eisenbacteria bacterium]
MRDNQELRITRQRQVILEELEGDRTHPTAEALHQRVRQRLPRISLATVYRNLEILAERGLVRRLDLGGGRRRFDPVTEEHYHVRCLGCGAIADVARPPSGPADQGATAPEGWRIVGHELEFTGYCRDCREASPCGAGSS